MNERLEIRTPARAARSGPALAPQPADSEAVHHYGSVAISFEEPAGGDGAAPAATDLVVDQDTLDRLDLTERLGVEAFLLRQSEEYVTAKANRTGEGDAWEMHSCTDVVDTPPPEQVVTRAPGGGIAPGPGAPAPNPGPTSAYLEGSVAVGIVIVNGPTADLQFTAAEQAKVVAEVQNGLGWLATMNPAGGISFHYDVRVVNIGTAANAPAPDNESRWRNPAMAALGYSADFNGVWSYVQNLRTTLGTRWTYCGFFVKYPQDWFAYASIGGPRIAMQYANNGWGPDNIDRVFAHETGHIFGAPDEYAASGCDCGGNWGKFGEPNRNCENCAGASGTDCLMRANMWALCPSSKQHFGWSPWPATIFPVHSGHTLDVTAVSTAAGAGIQQWQYVGWGNQRFRVEPLDDGTVRVVAQHSGLVWDVEAASTADGARIIQWTWHGGPNQRFYCQPLGDGNYRFIAKHSGKALDVFGASTANGAKLIQWPWHGGNNQRFRVTPISTSIRPVHSGLSLDVAGGSFDANVGIIQWATHGGGNQRFHLGDLGDGSFRIQAHHSGLVWDVSGASTTLGARIIQWPWHGGNNQRFLLEPLGDGTFRLVAKHSGLALDIAGASTANGAQLLQWAWHGGTNQRFRLM